MPLPLNNRLPASPGHAHGDADLARAFQELAKGERTASAMETQLTAVERKIDDLLATVASAHVRRSKIDEATTQSASNVTGTSKDQSKEK